MCKPVITEGCELEGNVSNVNICVVVEDHMCAVVAGFYCIVILNIFHQNGDDCKPADPSNSIYVIW